ncbi:fibronectin type III domain-containing protein [Paenibacillus radicis (ex Xue et al. 2023)]|uniref:Fibronectin type III domain-containing protein n=1 Tax=Paenibacillus radicis (ex Xue et al. 2023) TaxID=2972489 RepID=A0ABT1YSN7_9BACL|nr:fibronectin type III domain-containing protein [Paenibacillus radicis (ex Xue et al. 2023)]MCR8635735.1 fibronectin type III domain-containing protein [Paenibacillus radicis (ex Xue et al. 2023)]
MRRIFVLLLVCLFIMANGVISVSAQSYSLSQGGCYSNLVTATNKSLSIDNDLNTFSTHGSLSSQEACYSLIPAKATFTVIITAESTSIEGSVLNVYSVINQSTDGSDKERIEFNVSNSKQTIYATFSESGISGGTKGVNFRGSTGVMLLGTNLKVYEIQVIDGVPATPIPTNLIATAGNSQVTLTWTAITGSTGYNIKRSTTPGGPYSTIASNVTGTTYTDANVTNGTKYYYVVTAVGTGGESGNSNEASATPQGTVTPPTGNKALLVITLVSGLEKEYDLPMSEVNNFITWYNGRAAGTGSEVYTINKSFNKANFLTRKDYIAFDKIETFEVSEYTPAP